MPTPNSNALALDIGERRIGVAIANLLARLPRPLMTLQNSPSLWDELHRLIDQEQVELLVVGLPRGLDGQETAQTKYIRTFVEELKQQVSLPVYLQDEALTSHHAEAELKKNGKLYAKDEIDALAATIILQDFLTSFTGENHE